MKIDGRAIAEKILMQLKRRVDTLKKKHITPHLVVLRVGNDHATTSYIAQKEKMTKSIGGIIHVYTFPNDVQEETLLKKLHAVNKDQTVHGIIVQLPLPKHIREEKLLHAIDPKKDIDGFHPNSNFPMPLAAAVMTILEEIFTRSHLVKGETFNKWLRKQKIVVTGKGKTGGKPIIELLKEQNIQPIVIDSKTLNPEKFTKQADIIITAVGKGKIFTKTMMKRGAILIGIGMYKGEDNKFYGDYDEDEIKDIASFYTPIPGGVGPVNAAKLIENLVRATEISLH